MYVCTPNRSFKPADHIAFYAEGAIQPLTPKIGSVIESIDVRQQDQIDSLDRSRKELAQVLHGKIEEKPHPYFGGNTKIMFLSGPDDTETVKLEGAYRERQERQKWKRCAVCLQPATIRDAGVTENGTQDQSTRTMLTRSLGQPFRPRTGIMLSTSNLVH